MKQEELKEFVDKYPDNYELGKEVRKYYHKQKEEENSNIGMLWVGFLFLAVFLSLLTWIVVV
jgi:hypothetical protein